MIHNNEKLRPCPMLENPKHAAAHGAGELGADYDKQRQTASADIPVVGCVTRWGFLPLRLTTSDRIKLAARIAKVAKTVVSAFGVMISSLSFFVGYCLHITHHARFIFSS